MSRAYAASRPRSIARGQAVRPPARGPARPALSAALALWLAAVAGACGGGARAAAPAPAPPTTSAPTQALLDRAHQAERARRYDQARALYQRAVEAAPDRASKVAALGELASALLFWGELDHGAAVLEREVALAPGQVSAWHDLGVVRARLGDVAGAERALDRAIALAPDEPRPRVALAALLVNQHRWDQALVQYRALEHLALPERTRRAVVRAIQLIESARAGAAAP